MLSRPIARTRIPLARPLRPPNTPTRKVPQPRLITTRTRPQLPYLTQPTLRLNGGILGPNPQLARLISTENRRYVSEQLYLAVKWTLVFWLFATLSAIAYLGILIEVEERARPSPSEWKFWTRWSFRSARSMIREGGEGGAGMDWAAVGSLFRRCLTKLEDRGGEGKGVLVVKGGGMTRNGELQDAKDVSAKSWAWMQGYYEVLMGCALAAEHLDGMVLDKTRSLVFPKEVVIGPSNPDPRPVPSYLHTAPKEENCVPAFDSADDFYERILETRGFTTKQKVDAALALANWYDFKGMDESAHEILRWGVAIAASALTKATADRAHDSRTSVIKVGNTSDGRVEATANLLNATTALGVQKARMGKVDEALPILLSVLRAKRSALVSSVRSPASSSRSTRESEQPKTDIAAATGMVRSLFAGARQSIEPLTTGDEPYTKTSEKPSCEEAELMLYIGEILFASSSSSEEGLGWTRQAVAVAEANLQAGTTGAAEEKTKCQACLKTGIGNWETMLHRLAEEQGNVAAREGGAAVGGGWLEWRGWFGQDGGQKGKTMEALKAGMVQEELRRVQDLKERMLSEGVGGVMEKARPSSGMGVFVG
ncbi:hypothetical protein LTR97_012766 [Elasticomyces elasticus]|uniref:Uncharacterized protein n=1 Tax=Elasticomyces elasticus TaxID=574655 RepID=A0AAN7VW91_9PEZI|nr:hypothetical protein LTR97_012766 [Elasticomyces elasticus]